MARRWLLGGLLICVCVSGALGRPGVVRTKDGRAIEGDVSDKGVDGATITTKAASVSIARGDIESIEYAGDIKELYLQRLKDMPKDAGAKAHMDLARWLYESKAYELARTEADTALALEPNNADASVLKQTIERTIVWERARAAGGTTNVPKPPASATRPTAIGPKDRRLLDADQINIIRQKELKPTEKGFRVRLEGDVEKRFVESATLDPRAFRSLPDYSKALEILGKGAPEMRQDVKVLSDPQAVMAYKMRIQSLLLSGCASMACHGGKSAGSFVLYNPADNDAVTYTNFYILMQYSTDIGGTTRKAIHRLYPANSLVAQYGLAREKAELKHPEAQGWAPIFRNEQDPRYALLITWIGQALVAVEPEYKIEFALPSGTAPATQPAREEKKVEPPAPPPPPPPPPKQQPTGQNKGGGGVNDALKEARDRMRPIRGL